MPDQKNTPEPRVETGFTVDTHLFRELGELLVGRESTALIELVKNSYDADATEVVVFGEHLTDRARGIIRISDDGVGMDLDTFVKGFLRIASRLRDAGTRKSLRWSRRFTGAKGVGRLAAHKLAAKIDIRSSPLKRSDQKQASPGVSGHIDWDQVERVETLDRIPPEAVRAQELRQTRGEQHGTVLTLTKLRQKWTKTQLGNFLVEVEGLRAPPSLCKVLPKSVAPDVLLFGEPKVVDASSSDLGFKVRLEGDFEMGDSYWPAVLESSNWLLEIDAQPRLIRYGIAPTKRTTGALPDARPVKLTERHPNPESGPCFQARILIREGNPTGKRDERGWASRVSGVRVYMEGFRVLPYGQEADDWLSLTRDTTDRTRKLRFLADSTAGSRLEESEDEGLLLLPNKHYFGAIFLTANRSGGLRMLVNREGFVPDRAFETLLLIVRRGIDLATRVRAAAKMPDGDKRDARWPAKHSLGDEVSTPGKRLKATAEGSLLRLSAQASQLEALASEVPEAVAKKLRVTVTEIHEAASLSRELLPANSMVLVLASVGTQLAAFNHEVGRLLSLAGDLETTANHIRDEEMPARVRGQINRLAAAASDLRRAIERQAAYLVDIVTPDARRRRSRQRIADVLDATWRLVAPIAEQHEISFRNDVDPEHRSPRMFRAELMAVFTNLLTNAVKAAGDEGTVRATSDQLDGGRLAVRLENTGVAVDLDTAERWFKPFESTTVEVDPVLGQGMGLGLGITRDLLGEVGATTRFVRPRRPFATAIEVLFVGV